MSTKIVVCSDTHGHIRQISDEISELKGIDRIFHLGDYSSDVEGIEIYTGRNVISVRGNNDYYDWHTPAEKVLEIEAFRILLVHGHEFNVYRGPEELCRYAKQLGCDITVFGHTHVYDCGELNGVFYLNPGAVSWPRGDQQKSYAILTLEKGKDPTVERCILE